MSQENFKQNIFTHGDQMQGIMGFKGVCKIQEYSSTTKQVPLVNGQNEILTYNSKVKLPKQEVRGEKPLPSFAYGGRQ